MTVKRGAEHRPRPLDWVRYWFDSRLASGTRAMVFWLAVAALLLIVLVSAVAALTNVRANGVELSFEEAVWANLMRTLDPGTMGEDVGWPLRVASLTATLGGILIISSLFATLSHGIRERATRLKRQQSPVIASDHVLILGWSPKIFALVQQLFAANPPKRTGTVVVLAPLATDEMERQIRARLPRVRERSWIGRLLTKLGLLERGPWKDEAELGLTKRQRRALVLRTGRAYEPEHLRVVKPHQAKATVVLNPGHADGDAEVVRATLALLGIQPAPERPVVAEVLNRFTASALEDVPGREGQVRVVRAADFIARMAAQVCRQPGLSTVYQDVLEFDGREIYFAGGSGVEGRTFAEALLCYENASLLGIKRGHEISLCPPMDREIVAGDEVIAVAEERHDIVATSPRAARARGAGPPPPELRPERILLIGWNQMAPEVIRQLDRYLAPGSSITVRIDPEVAPRAFDEVPVGLSSATTHVDVDPLDPEKLRDLMREDPPDHVILLCYKESLSEAEADSRVLLTLLHLRDAIHRAGADTNIVAELLDERDVRLTDSRPNDEFIVSERLTALLLAQYSENPDLQDVFDELLEARGAEIYLKPAHLYSPDEPVTFADVVAAASARGEIAIGYQTKLRAKPTLNPPKGATVDLRGGRVVVVAEEEG